MSLKSIITIRNMIETQYNHWVIFPLVLSLVLINQSIFDMPFCSDWAVWLVCGAFPLMGRLCFDRIEKKIVFVLCNGTLFGVLSVFCYFAGKSAAVFITALFFYTGLTIYFKFSNGRNLTTGFLSPAVPIVISVLSVLVLHSIDVMHYDAAFLAMNILFLGVYLIGYYLSDYIFMVSINKKNVGNMSEKAIFDAGFRGLLALVLIYMLIAFFCVNATWMQNAAKYSGEWMQQIVHYIVMLFSENPESEILEFEEGEQLLLPAEEGEAGIVVKIFILFGTGVIYVTVIACVFMIFVGLVKGLKELLGGQFTKNTINQFSEDEVFEVREKYIVTSKSHQKRSLFVGKKTIAEKIRSLYHKKLIADSLFTSGIGKSEYAREKITAREYANIKNIPELAEVYEKARYSNEDCDKQDLKKMQKYM